MNLNDLITEVYLKIKRNLEYLRFHEEVKDLFKLLNNKFIDIQDSYNNLKQTDKDNIEFKKYYANLMNFLENDIKQVTDLLDNYFKRDKTLSKVTTINYLDKASLLIYDDSQENINIELRNKIEEIIKCIKEIETQYIDDELVNYIKNKYKQIMDKYQKQLNICLLYKEKVFKESLINNYNPNLTLYSNINSIKEECITSLSVVLDDFITYLTFLNENNSLIEEKEERILNNIKFIEENLNYSLKEKFETEKTKYENSIKNTNLIKMEIGRYQNSYIEFLNNLELEIEIILLFIKNNEEIHKFENNLLNKIRKINNYLTTPLESELKTLKKTYFYNTNNLKNYNQETIKYQQDYLNELINFEKQRINSYQEEYENNVLTNNYIEYLTNTNHLLVRFDLLFRILIFLNQNPNQKLENAIYKFHYQMLLLKIYYKNNKENDFYEKLDTKTKIYIEKFFITEMEVLSKNNEFKDFYFKYLKDGLSSKLLLEYVNKISSYFDELANDASIKFDENEVIPKEAIEYKTIYEYSFFDNFTYIKDKENNYYVANIDGDVLKINFDPTKFHSIHDIKFKNGIIMFTDKNINHAKREPLLKTIYITKNEMVESDYFESKYAPIDGTKFIINNKTFGINNFYIADSEDDRFAKEIDIKKIKKFIRRNKWLFDYREIETICNVSIIRIHDFIDDVIRLDIEVSSSRRTKELISNKTSYKKYLNVFTISYNYKTDKIEKNSRVYSHLDIKQINHSLTFDGNNYHFIKNDMNCLYQTLNIEELIKSEQKNLIKKSKNV